MALVLFAHRHGGDLNGQAFGPRATTYSNNGCRAAIVQATTDPHVPFIWTDPIGGVEADPTEPVDEELRPGVAGFIDFADLLARQIATDVAGGKTKQARRRACERVRT